MDLVLRLINLFVNWRSAPHPQMLTWMEASRTVDLIMIGVIVRIEWSCGADLGAYVGGPGSPWAEKLRKPNREGDLAGGSGSKRGPGSSMEAHRSPDPHSRKHTSLYLSLSLRVRAYARTHTHTHTYIYIYVHALEESLPSKAGIRTPSTYPTPTRP